MESLDRRHPPPRPRHRTMSALTLTASQLSRRSILTRWWPGSTGSAAARPTAPSSSAPDDPAVARAIDAATPPRRRRDDPGLRSARVGPAPLHRHRQPGRRPQRRLAARPLLRGRQGRHHRRLAGPARSPRALRGLLPACSAANSPSSRSSVPSRASTTMRATEAAAHKLLDVHKRPIGHLQSGRRQCRAGRGAGARPTGPAISGSMAHELSRHHPRRAARRHARRGARPESGRRNPRRHRRRPRTSRCRPDAEIRFASPSKSAFSCATICARGITPSKSDGLEPAKPDGMGGDFRRMRSSRCEVRAS